MEDFILKDLIGWMSGICIIYFLWHRNHNTRVLINNWAYENNYKIISKIFVPWHFIIPYIAGGIHPANFEVIIEDQGGVRKKYKITGGGIFWLENAIKIKELK